MQARRVALAFVLTAALSLVAACDTSKERAEKHYQAGLAYLEKGDVSRAVIEFKNVFKLDGTHKEARLTFARLERDRGNMREAFSQYLRLVEQYPDNLDGLTALTELAIQGGVWEQADRHITAALALSPDDVRLQALRTVTDYGRATETTDVTVMISAAAKAREMVKTQPDNLFLRKVIIDDLMRAQDYQAALVEIARAIEIAPKERALYAQRLSIHAALNDDAAVEASLKEMVAVFPDAPEMDEALVRWYVSQKNYDAAEAYLRSLVKPDDKDTGAELELVRFLAEFRGMDAAVAELDSKIDGGRDLPIFRSVRAGFLFDQGDREKAIADMMTVLADAKPSAETRKIKIGLARMQEAAGNSVAARALVEEVLKEDAGDGEALKLKSRWLIQSDQVGEAINDLRRVLDQSPRDADAMTLMAQAYERDGSRDLMREMLSLAVEASNRAPAESLRYAQFLAGDNKLLPAEGVLIDALRMSPGNKALLTPLGQIYVHVQDWSRADGVAAELEKLDDAEAKAAAAAIRAASLAGQAKTDEAIGYLENLAAQGTGGIGTKLAIIRAHLGNGDTGKAVAYAAKILSESPDDPDLQFIDASVRELSGDSSAAEIVYRRLIEEDPNRLPVWMALFRAVSQDPNRLPDADGIADDALKLFPDSPELLWAKAGVLERQGNVDGAIDIYEGLYRANSANPIIANNLASLLSSHRADPDSLKRAEVIARRLRGSNVPPYQDTFGWIAYRMGNLSDAVPELEKAAAGLPEDPQVQYHLGMAYLAAERREDAATQFRKALDLLSEGDTSELALSVRAELEKLDTAPGAGN